MKARVVRDKRTNKTKGYGFISFKDPQDFIRASKEMNGTNHLIIFSYFFRSLKSQIVELLFLFRRSICWK